MIIAKLYCHESALLRGALSEKKHFSKYIIFMASFAGQGVLNKDPTVCPHGARPPPRYVSKYIEIKIAESYINDLQFGDNTIQQLKL